jgi:asparagine synthase (glutamine-hydrolysing)
LCGLTGFVGPGDTSSIVAMTKALGHRGPDSSGIINPTKDLYLGHTRLSIVDLSTTGQQPMWSHNGRFCIVLNGEIYNFKTLGQKLTRDWRGSSDTEVVLEAISEWGIQNALEQFVGMFAFALYDKIEKKIYLARDRFGEKPLYYANMGEHFIFGSELKSLISHPSFNKIILREALSAYFKYNYVPAPLSIYENTFKLRPAHFIEFDLESKKYSEKRYWELSVNPIFKGSYTTAVDELEQRLKVTIREQMRSDVSIGAFLSGGIDSSAIVALMQNMSSQPVKTFSIGFYDKKYNEAEYAKKVAEYLKTDHTEMYVTADDALRVVPNLFSIYDEPFSDSSQIPTYLVSAITKKHVTVALSGDGGDEVFGGYSRYFTAPQILNKFKYIPSSFRSLAAKGITSISPQSWDKVLPFPGDRMHKFATVLGLNTKEEVYNRLITHWENHENPVLSNELIPEYKLDPNLSFEESMMFLDTMTYLPDDILVKVDRAGMSVSLESRIPFLDHRIVEFAWTLPLHYKVRNGTGKRILKDVLYKHVPRELIDRPKKGFSVPLEHWLRKELKDWAISLLDEKKIKEAGLLNYDIIKLKWDEHQSGVRNWQYLLWDVLMFQDWYENSFIR